MKNFFAIIRRNHSSHGIQLDMPSQSYMFSIPTLFLSHESNETLTIFAQNIQKGDHIILDVTDPMLGWERDPLTLSILTFPSFGSLTCGSY